MSRRVPLNVRFRPQPVDTAEIERSSTAASELLAEPADWLRRLHAARVDVVLYAPASRKGPMNRHGFEPLCSAWVGHPGPTGRIERLVEVWVDASTTVRAEVIGGRVYLSTHFDDGTALVLLEDQVVGGWLQSPICEVLPGIGDISADLRTFRERLAALTAEGRSPLVCANGELYRQHLDLATRHGTPPTTRRAGTFVYPMTLLLAAEVVAQRDAFADRSGLPG